MVIHRRDLILIFLFLALLLLPPAFGSENDTLIGSAAPPFNVASGNKEILTLDDTKGKTIVLFYETKGAIENNRKLKTALNEFYDKQTPLMKKAIMRIAVIDCQGVFFRNVWEKALRKNSLKEGITIYGDWDGKMSTDYRAKKDESNVIIIDKKGTIRYYASGQVKDEDVSAIEGLLESLLKES